MGSPPLYLDGIRVYCVPGSTRALYSCGYDVPDLRIHRAQEILLFLSFLPGQSIYYLNPAVSGQKSHHQDQEERRSGGLLLAFQSLSSNWSVSALADVFPCRSHMPAYSFEKDTPSRFHISSPWSHMRNHRVPCHGHLGFLLLVFILFLLLLLLLPY